MLGDFLKEKRTKSKMTIESIRSKLKVSVDYVNCVEANQIFSFSDVRIKEIIAAYELSSDETEKFLSYLKK